MTCKYLEVKLALEEADLNSDSTNWGNYKDSNLTLTSGKYAINNGSEYTPWIPYTTDTENYVTNSVKSESNIVYLTTGASSKTSILNISDFAGNSFEYTLEYTGGSGNPCSLRGGACSSNSSYFQAANHNSFSASNSRYAMPFRATLY